MRTSARRHPRGADHIETEPPWNPARFRSRRDPDTGTYQYGSRIYQPTTGTWLQPDNARGANAPTDESIGTDPLLANRYSYVNGDPVNLIDPYGHAPCREGDTSCGAPSATGRGNPYGNPLACTSRLCRANDEPAARERGRSVRAGFSDLRIADGAEVVTFDIPTWEGQGVTRLQYFIDDAEVCLVPVAAACGRGDDRTFVEGAAIGDYNVGARVRVVLDHERGIATVVSYPSHNSDGSESAALPVDLVFDPGVTLPEDYPSQVRVFTHGEGVDGNVVFDYRFLNSRTPRAIAGVSPGIHGAIRVRRGSGSDVLIDGVLAQYPSVEIIRDRARGSGYSSSMIYTRQQASGGPSNLYRPGTEFSESG